MEARAQARYVRVTPRKARRVVDLIRGLPAAEAQAVLAFAPQAASDPVGKVLASAIANAEATGRADREALVVSRAWVDEGPTLKRFRPRAQGRAYRINKRTSHITVIIAEEEAIAAMPEPTQRGGAQQRPRRVSVPRLKRPARRGPEAAEVSAAEATAAEDAPDEVTAGGVATEKGAAGEPADEPADEPAAGAAGDAAGDAGGMAAEGADAGSGGSEESGTDDGGTTATNRKGRTR